MLISNKQNTHNQECRHIRIFPNNFVYRKPYFHISVLLAPVLSVDMFAHRQVLSVDMFAHRQVLSVDMFAHRQVLSVDMTSLKC